MEINFMAVALGGVAFWVLGALWYSPLLFGKAWQSEVGLSDDDIKGGNMAIIFGGSLILMMMMSMALYFAVASHPAEEMTFTHGMFHGMMMGVLTAAASMGINYLYQRRSIKLFAIDAIYQVLGLALSGGVMALLI